MSLTLFLDTTLSGTSLALLSKKKPSAEASLFTQFHFQKGASDSAICRMLAEGLVELGRDLNEIDSIVVSHGPGSFTGIKVGLAWAYGFQAARKENLLVGMSSLAEGQSVFSTTIEKKKVAILLPISRREAFLCWQDGTGGHCFSSIVLFSAAAETVLQDLGKVGMHFALIATDLAIGEWLSKLKLHTTFHAMDEFMKVAMDGMIAKAEKLDLNLLRSQMVSPYYLKKSTVEENLLLKDSHVS